MLLLSRCLYALILLCVLVIISGIFWPLSELENMTADKIKLRKITVNDIRPFKAISIPLKNVFDPEGKDWKKQQRVKTHSADESKHLKDIKGILQLPSMSGVLTDKGFVAVGEKLGGWKLLRVENGKAVLQKQGKKVDVLVDKSRKSRKTQFESLGFPFLK